MRLHQISVAFVLCAVCVTGGPVQEPKIQYLTRDVSSSGLYRAAEILAEEFTEWMKTGHKSETLDGLVEELAVPSHLQHANWNLATGRFALMTCVACQGVAKSVIKSYIDGVPKSIIVKKLIKMCSALKIESPEVCDGLINKNMPVLFHIIGSKSSLSPHDFCGVVLQFQRCSTASDEFRWNVTIDKGPRKSVSLEKSDETVKLVQISDIHYDPNYEPYGNPNCNAPTCCRKGQNATNTSGKVAGYWGDYNNCDTPWEAVVDALDHIKRTHQNVSYIYFTGDIMDHGIWETTKPGNAESLTRIYTKIRDTFPDQVVYPLLGNHEPHPLNLYAPSAIVQDHLSTQWLYTLLADLWIDFGWLPESTRSTILQGGFYTVSPKKGFRIIALNNNVCYTYNWWLLYEPRDIDGQLTWLAETLLKAEKAGEIVHILAHIPPGDAGCQYTWSEEYRKIVLRFSHVIAAEFNGHTHSDEVTLYYDSENAEIVKAVAWNGGSVTTYANVNPNYKVYHLNSNTLEVDDYEMWMYNLTKANETPTKNPDWYMSYSFKNQYGLNDLSLGSLSTWVDRLSTNRTMLHNYYENSVKRADPSLKVGCNEGCLRSLLCQLRTSSAQDFMAC